MATNLVANDVLLIKATCYDAVSTQIGLNVTHWRVTAPAGNITDDDVAVATDTEWEVPYKAFMSQLSQWRGSEVQLIRGVNRFAPVISAAKAGNGTGGLTQLPTQTTGLIKFHTATSLLGSTGKRYSVRGRIYPPFPATTFANAEGRMNAAGLLAVGDIAATYLPTKNVNVAGRTATLILMIETSDALTQFADVTANIPIQAFATQRRRGELGRTNPLPF